MHSSDVDSDVEEAWNIGCDSLIPVKSKQRHEKTYNLFQKWLTEKRMKIDEKSILAYFVRQGKKLKSPGSSWAEYSMLKSTINLNHDIDISQNKKLVAFLKKKYVEHCPKKTSVFSREELNKFLTEASDKEFLMMKVVVIMGVAGACRRVELSNLLIDDIEDKGSVVIVNLPDTKTNIRRIFTTVENADDEVHVLDIFEYTRWPEKV